MNDKFKIISNPYKKTTKFMIWDERSRQWHEYNNVGSDLLNVKYEKGFFPYFVEEIVSLIIRDIGDPREKLTILFEGTSDEFHELEEVCSKYSNSTVKGLHVLRGEKKLENAREILPAVNSLFREMTPVIEKTLSDSNDYSLMHQKLERFSDAANDVTPIFIFGNYSSGKSTFINALIGSEILPSAARACTAKVYKIKKSEEQESAVIEFTYDDQKFVIGLSDTKVEEIEGNLGHLPKIIQRKISDISQYDVIKKVRLVLELINDYVDEEGSFSDLIEVKVPFKEGVLARISEPFVIIDTPGSNTASHEEHLNTLKKELSKMTNGLPVYLCVADQMDTKDNQSFTEELLENSGMDKRFTIIAVNKSDRSETELREVTEEEKKRILEQKVPEAMFSGELMYVSSVMGLGSKTRGNFEKNVLKTTYNEKKDRFSNRNNSAYCKLYLYNILPNQIKQRSVREALEEPNLIYANSGLYSVEKEIEAFVTKYSAYNKCLQSHQYLEDIIKKTRNIIGKKTKEQREEEEKIRTDFKNKKITLQDKLRKKTDDLQEECKKEYQNNEKEVNAQIYSKAYILRDWLTGQEHIIRAKQQEEKEYHEKKIDISAARAAARKHVGDTFAKVIILPDYLRRPSIDSNLDDGDIFADIQNIIKARKKESAARQEIKKDSVEEFRQTIINTYKEQYGNQVIKIDSQSREFWAKATENIRKALLETVDSDGSDVLKEDRKNELEQIIISFDRIAFREPDAESRFSKEDFQKKYSQKMLFWIAAGKLDLKKIENTYNEDIRWELHEAVTTIYQSHMGSAIEWIGQLFARIDNNIVEYNPNLFRMNQRIQELRENRRILSEMESQLDAYMGQFETLMSWK